MGKYKFTDKNQTAVMNTETGYSGIKPGVWMWEQYLEWAASGGITDPHETSEEIEDNERKAELTAITETFKVESSLPVVALGITWNGGQASAGAIQGAAGLAEFLGEQEVVITDINDEEYTLSITQAMQVAAAIGVRYREAFLKKQRAKVKAKAKAKTK